MSSVLSAMLFISIGIVQKPSFTENYENILQVYSEKLSVSNRKHVHSLRQCTKILPVLKAQFKVS